MPGRAVPIKAEPESCAGTPVAQCLRSDGARFLARARHDSNVRPRPSRSARRVVPQAGTGDVRQRWSTESDPSVRGRPPTSIMSFTSVGTPANRLAGETVSACTSARSKARVVLGLKVGLSPLVVGDPNLVGLPLGPTEDDSPLIVRMRWKPDGRPST